MKLRLLFFALLLLLSCDPEKHDIDKGIAEMSEYREETPAEDTVGVDCLHDTSYYKLTMEALRGIPDAKDVQWIEQEHTAVVNWRGDEVRRSRGGCMQFNDDLELATLDTTDLADALHWLGKAQAVTTHFGIPYFAKAIADKKAVFDPSMSDAQTKFFRLDAEIPAEVVLEGFLIQRIGDRTRLSFRQFRQ
jgi:hypothetical protein